MSPQKPRAAPGAIVTEPPLSCDNTLLQANEVALVEREEGRGQFTSVLFMRAHLMEKQDELLQFISSDRKFECYVEGPPGCGKVRCRFEFVLPVIVVVVNGHCAGRGDWCSMMTIVL